MVSATEVCFSITFLNCSNTVISAYDSSDGCLSFPALHSRSTIDDGSLRKNLLFFPLCLPALNH